MAELSQVAPAAVPVQGPGARLKAGREAQNQSLEQAARHLRLDEPTLAAIEADQYPAHVPATFLRGYLRAYAKWLELPADEIVAVYNELHPDEATLAGLKNLLPLPEHSGARKGSWLWWGLAIVLVLLIALAVLLLPADWLAQLRESTSSPAESAQQALPLPAEATSGELKLDLATEPDTATPADVSATGPSTNPATDPATGPSAESASGSPAGTVATPVPSPAAAVAAEAPADAGLLAAAGERLEFSFDEDCWIRVTDASGAVLSVGIKQKGQRIRLSGAAPLTVVLGNPPGVQLRHNGQPVDLSTYPASRPATLTITTQRNE